MLQNYCPQHPGTTLYSIMRKNVIIFKDSVAFWAASTAIWKRIRGRRHDEYQRIRPSKYYITALIHPNSVTFPTDRNQFFSYINSIYFISSMKFDLHTFLQYTFPFFIQELPKVKFFSLYQRGHKRTGFTWSITSFGVFGFFKYPNSSVRQKKLSAICVLVPKSVTNGWASGYRSCITWCVGKMNR